VVLSTGVLATETPAATKTKTLETTDVLVADAPADGGNLLRVCFPALFDDSLGQVTNVTQLQDVQPRDWAYVALQELVERYGCIAGYPDGTFRGNRALTRYEFAAGLNACLDRVNELIAAATSDKVRKEDPATYSGYKRNLQLNLHCARRVDARSRYSAIEANQFSPLPS